MQVKKQLLHYSHIISANLPDTSGDPTPALPACMCQGGGLLGTMMTLPDRHIWRSDEALGRPTCCCRVTFTDCSSDLTHWPSVQLSMQALDPVTGFRPSLPASCWSPYPISLPGTQCSSPRPEWNCSAAPVQEVRESIGRGMCTGMNWKPWQ